MGTNPSYDPKADDLPDTPKLATWQKVFLGVISAVAVIGAPVVAATGPEIATACLANPAGCAEVVAEIGTGGAAGGSMPSGSAYGGAANAANGGGLGKQLDYEADAAAASKMFPTDGELTAETIARSMKIQDGTKMGNEHVKDYFAAHGGADRWGKYATPGINIPGGEGTLDVHFYRNEVSGEIYYYDYKVKLGGGERR